MIGTTTSPSESGDRSQNAYTPSCLANATKLIASRTVRGSGSLPADVGAFAGVTAAMSVASLWDSTRKSSREAGREMQAVS